MVEVNKLTFLGQHIFVGMDVHKKSWKVSIFSEHLELKTFTMPPDVGTLVKHLRRNYPGARYHCVYEAGFCGYWIHDQLKAEGIDCLVVNPADVPTKDKERKRKADKPDCRKLSRGLRSGDIEGIYVPTREMTEDRGLIRTRRSMVRKQARCKNQIKAILSFYGIHIPEYFDHWSNNFIKWIGNIVMKRASGNTLIKIHLEELQHLRRMIARLNKEIRALARTDKYRRNVLLLRAIPGIGTLSAMILLTELFDILRFKNLDKLASYAGLTPDKNSSGEKERNTEMTSRRNVILRDTLIECAWVAARKDPALLMCFNRLIKRMKKTQAIIRISRKLSNRIMYVLKNQHPYVMGVIE